MCNSLFSQLDSPQGQDNSLHVSDMVSARMCTLELILGSLEYSSGLFFQTIYFFIEDSIQARVTMLSETNLRPIER